MSSSDAWTWTDGSNFGYTNWGKGEPHAEVVPCLSVDPASGQWFVRSCNDPRYYVCAVKSTESETPVPQPKPVCCPSGWTFSDVSRKCHKLVHNVRWNDGLAACEADNGTLASIHSEEENNWIAAFAALQVDDWNRIWIGFNDIRKNGKWEFSDGSQADYVNWGPDRPLTGAGQNCAFLHTDVPQEE
ncbi:CRE-CLEC-51 protein, partial [Aphelenchoides avenae]